LGNVLKIWFMTNLFLSKVWKLQLPTWVIDNFWSLCDRLWGGRTTT
jgi:hypothetical protein